MATTLDHFVGTLSKRKLSQVFTIASRNFGSEEANRTREGNELVQNLLVVNEKSEVSRAWCARRQIQRCLARPRARRLTVSLSPKTNVSVPETRGVYDARPSPNPSPSTRPLRSSSDAQCRKFWPHTGQRAWEGASRVQGQTRRSTVGPGLSGSRIGGQTDNWGSARRSANRRPTTRPAHQLDRPPTSEANLCPFCAPCRACLAPHPQHPLETVEALAVDVATVADPVAAPAVARARTRRRSGCPSPSSVVS